MDSAKTSSRLPAAERRQAIIEAAALVFAEHGFAGAKTEAIAKRAGVSPALLYRHFASKELLYRAVLRAVLRLQNEQLRRVPDDLRGASLAAIIRGYFEACVAIRNGAPDATGLRMTMASLVGDGQYARSIFRRAVRMRLPTVQAALEEAVQQGDLQTTIDPVNVFFFMYSVGSMLSLSRLQTPAVLPFAGDDESLVDQALAFCLRGAGFSQAYVARALAERRSS